MGYIKIWVHLVWTTKNRKPILNQEVLPEILTHIKDNARDKGIFLDSINGLLNHIHCLIALKSGQNIDKILMLLKGESSFWINQKKIFTEKFEWQDQYFAVSLSESALDQVRAYIKNQEQHHKIKSFADEYQEFMSKYNFE